MRFFLLALFPFHSLTFNQSSKIVASFLAKCFSISLALSHYLSVPIFPLTSLLRCSLFTLFLLRSLTLIINRSPLYSLCSSPHAHISGPLSPSLSLSLFRVVLRSAVPCFHSKTAIIIIIIISSSLDCSHSLTRCVRVSCVLLVWFECMCLLVSPSLLECRHSLTMGCVWWTLQMSHNRAR